MQSRVKREDMNGAVEKVSVLMAVYIGDQSEFLTRALASITVEQIQPPGEVVLVEDGPLGEALNSVLDDWQIRLGSHLKRVVLRKNQGLGAALNAGLAACVFPLVARMDADDVALPGRLAAQLALLDKHPEVDICGGQAEDIDDKGRVLRMRRVPVDNTAIRRVIWSCPLIHPSVVFRRDRIVELGSYATGANQRQEDFELWVRAALNGTVFHNIDKVVLHYRVLGSHFSKNSPRVGFSRLRVGLRAVNAFDRRIYAYIALLYPFLRSFLPTKLAQKLHGFAERFDPRDP